MMKAFSDPDATCPEPVSSGVRASSAGAVTWPRPHRAMAALVTRYRRRAEAYNKLAIDFTEILFAGLAQAVAIAVGALFFAVRLVAAWPTIWTVLIAAATALCGGLRIAIFLAFRRRTRRGGLTIAEAKAWAVSYGAGALLLGICVALITTEAFLHGTVSDQLLTVGMSFAYSSGLAGHAAVYPEIGEVVGFLVLGIMSVNTATLGTLTSEGGSLLILAYYATIVRTISQSHRTLVRRFEADEEIEHLAYHDHLTGLPNRRAFNLATQALLLDGVRRCGRGVAILYLDLDRFKAVNDVHGHTMGDKLLAIVSQRLRDCVREGDMAARFGGDEFAVLQARRQGREETEALAERIVAGLSAPYQIDGQILEIGASVGIAVSPEDGEDAEALLHNADLALYKAKSAGRGQACTFNPAMHREQQDRASLVADLRLALDRGEMTLHYQPIIAGLEGRIECFEALLRWCHPTRGFVAPDVFIPLAEENGLIARLGLWALDMACREAAGWPLAYRVAVNLSPAQLRDDSFLTDVAASLRNAGLAPDRLELEITEGVLITDTERARAAIHALRALGIGITLDDFGTGHSSLCYLRSFPFDKLKIDRSFVSLAPQEAGSVAIVKAIVSLGHNLSLTVVAEGVETAEQMDLLVAESCDYMQGYLFGKPLPAAETRALIASMRRALTVVPGDGMRLDKRQRRPLGRAFRGGS